MYQQIWLPNQGDAFYKKTKTVPKRANGLDSRKGVHVKNLWSFVFMLIRREIDIALIIHYALKMVSRWRRNVGF